MQLTTRSQARDGSTVLAVNGELDYVSASRLTDAVHVLVDEHRVEIVADLSGLRFCDSSGISALVKAWKLLTDNGGRLILASVPPRIDRVLEMSGLTTILSRYPSVTEACRALNGHD